ncbi:MAG: acyl-CoA carboxylase subunit beta [Pseudonocardiales bacterium]|nr:acyl-CoA carboxylase subunit beta [Pseudonocardiales bacterium]
MAVDRSAQAWAQRLVDPGSWTPWHEAGGRAMCGCADDNEIRTGRARVDGVSAAIIVVGFRNGVATLSAHVATQVAAAFERARAEELPVVAVAASGGVRLQEGTRTFVALAGVAAAVTQHREAGLLFFCYLADPTTGGAIVSWAGLAAVRAAEPGALIAFTGPRVVELMTGRSMPSGACTAESMLHNGLVDAVVSPESLRGFVSALLRGTVAGDRPLPVRAPDPAPTVAIDAWEAVQRTRDPDRPGLREFVAHLDDPIELHGDGLGAGDDPAVLAIIGRLYGRKVVVVGHDRSAGPERAEVTPSGMRKSARAIELATRLDLPLVSVVDTPGPRLDAASEAAGIGFHLAAALADRARTTAPLVSVLLGEGGGGAALAFLPAHYTIAAASAWLAPMSPEGSSAVLHRSTDQAAAVAADQHITSTDLVAMGVVDLVVTEDGEWMDHLVAAVAAAITPD